MQEIRAGGPSTSTPPSASLAAPAPHPAPPAISGTPAPFTLEIELPESPDAIPAGTDQETLIAWIGKAQELGRVAQAKGDLDGFGKMGRLSASLLEAKRKGAPIPKADPNDRPDLIAAKEAARKRLHKLIDEVAA
jgi:hypothetical protein